MSISVGALPVTAAGKAEPIKLQYEHAVEDVQNQHYDRAYKRFHKIANRGHSSAQHISGLMCEKGCGTEQNLKKAVVYYKKAANHNFPDSQSKLGHMYLTGNAVVKRDYEKAKLWLEKAANNEVPEAQHTLGMMYANGQGVQQDFEKAGVWLRKAAGNGVQEAQEALTKLPAIPMPKSAIGGAGGNPLGAAGATYGSGLQSVKQSWSGYRDVIQVLNNTHQ